MKRLTALLALGALLGLLALAALAAITIAASGALVTRAGAWTTQIRIAPHAALSVNVPGLLRLVTTPLGLRLLDGRTHATRLGQLHFRRAGQTLIVRCAPCAIDDRRLHTRPLAIDALELRLATRDAATIDGRLAGGALQVPFTARLRAEGIAVDWSLESAAIAAIYRLLRHAIAEADETVIDGHIAARGSLQLPAATASTKVAIDGFAVSGLATERLQYGGFSFQCGGDVVATGDGQRHWIAADRLGALLPAAVLAAEDQRFHAHAGFDADEIAHALAHTAARGPARGASTITQQLARTLFTGGERTAVRKLRELLYAVEMERTLGKNRILELYLNTIDWGPGVCGARAAARTYFNQRPVQLSALQAAWLAGILRNPHAAYAGQFAAQAPDAERATAVLMQMRSLPRHERARAAQQKLAFAPPPAAAAAARYAAR